LTDFQNSFTGRFSGKFSTKSSLTIPPHLNCVITLPCEISVFKKLSCSRSEYEASYHAKLSHSKQLLKFLIVILALFSSLNKRYTEQPYEKSHMTVCISCDTEEKILQQNAFVYDKWTVSYFLPVTSPNVNRF